MSIAIMDNKGIIETFNDIDDAIGSIDRVRKENNTIQGDLKVIEIHYTFN